MGRQQGDPRSQFETRVRELMAARQPAIDTYAELSEQTGNEAEPDQERLYSAHALLDTNPIEALRELEQLTEQGSAKAPLYVGYAYYLNDAVAEDLKKAELNLKIAIDRGELEGWFYLGCLYEFSNRYDDAIEAFQQVITFAPAAFRIGKLIVDGKSSSQDFNAGVGHLKAAADQGSVYARRKLALLYVAGRFGKFRAIWGVWLFMKAMGTGVWIAMHDVEDDRIRH